MLLDGKEIIMNKKGSIATMQFRNAVITFTLIEICNSVACIIDGLITARFLGTYAIAGVGLTGLYFSICAIISFTLATAGQNLCANYIGKGNINKSNQICSTILGICILIGGALTILGIVFAGPMAHILGAKGENAILFDYAKEYFEGIYIGTIPNIIIASMSPLLALDGKGKRVNMASLTFVVSDIAMDLVNVLFLHWGTFGMGFATSASYILSAVIILSGLADRESVFKISVKNIRFSETKIIFLSGFPRGVGMIARTLGPIFINLYILSLAGTAGLAALSVQGSIKFLCMSLPFGISGAVLLMAGNYYGESDLQGIQSVVKLAIRFTGLIVIPLSIVLIIFTPQIADLYINISDPSHTMTVHLLRMFFLSLPILGLNFVAANILLAVEKTKATYVFNALNEFAGIVVFVCLLGELYGEKGAWAAFFIWQVVLLGGYCVIGLMRKSKIQKPFTKLLFVDDAFCSKQVQVFFTNIASYEDASREVKNVQEFCEENGIPSKQAYKLALCTEELSDNVVKHGFTNGKNNILEVRIAIDGSKMILHLRDNCRKFNFTNYVQTHEWDTQHVEKGLGIRMVTAMARDIQYTNTMNVNNLIVII